MRLRKKAGGIWEEHLCLPSATLYPLSHLSRRMTHQKFERQLEIQLPWNPSMLFLSLPVMKAATGLESTRLFLLCKSEVPGPSRGIHRTAKQKPVLHHRQLDLYFLLWCFCPPEMSGSWRISKKQNNTSLHFFLPYPKGEKEKERRIR